MSQPPETLTTPAATSEQTRDVVDTPATPRPQASETYTTAQDSLRQASENLDAAFSRLRELRSSLREIMASQAAQNANPEFRSRVGPSHAAIVLTDASTPLSPSPPAPEFINPPYAPESYAPDWSELGPFRFISRHVDDLPTPPHEMDEDLSYVSSPLPLPSPRAPTQWRLSSRVLTQAPPNEPSTSLGRRVAARQAGDTPLSGPQRAFRSVSVADLMRAARRRQIDSRTGNAATGTVLPPERTDYISSAALVRARDSRMRAEARTRFFHIFRILLTPS